MCWQGRITGNGYPPFAFKGGKMEVVILVFSSLVFAFGFYLEIFGGQESIKGAIYICSGLTGFCFWVLICYLEKLVVDFYELKNIIIKKIKDDGRNDL